MNLLLKNKNFRNNHNYILWNKEKNKIILKFEFLYLREYFIENLLLNIILSLILYTPCLILSSIIFENLLSLNGNSILFPLGAIFILNIFIFFLSKKNFNNFYFNNKKFSFIEFIFFYIFLLFFFSIFIYIFMNTKKYRWVFLERVWNEKKSFYLEWSGLFFIVHIDNYMLLRLKSL